MTVKIEVETAPLYFKLYDMAIGEDDARYCRDISEDHCQAQPKSFVLHILAMSLSKAGDAFADARVVLPWLIGLIGAPAFLIGFLVPLRESFALLPQILIGGVIRRYAVRKSFWVMASLAEGLCIIGMAATAVSGLSGALAGWIIIGLLTLFSIARGVASIASKDVLAKTVSKGRRGRVNGYASMMAGVAAGVVGFYFALSPAEARPEGLLYGILAFAGLMWLLAALSYAKVPEQPGATAGGRGIVDLMADQIQLLRNDKELQRFLVARALMIATSLTGPIYVAMAQVSGDGGLASLGWLMVAAGLAGALSSAFWGKLSDKTARWTMAAGALMAAILGVGVATARWLEMAWSSHIAFFGFALFVLGIAHAGVRIGRKTQVVDISGPDQKSEYVALSNTIIGVLLLGFGVIAGGLMAWSLDIALVVLSSMASLGALVALTMKNAQAEEPESKA